MRARIDRMCYGGKHAWASRAARKNSKTSIGQRTRRCEPSIRPGRLPVCCYRCGSLRKNVARWRSRGGRGVGFRTPARAHPYHNGLASGLVRGPNRRLLLTAPSCEQEAPQSLSEALDLSWPVTSPGARPSQGSEHGGRRRLRRFPSAPA